MEDGLLLLDDAAIRGLAIAPAAMAQAVRAAFLEQSARRARTSPKLSLPAPGGVNFSAKGGVLDAEQLAVVKWYGYVPHNEQRGLPDFTPLVLVSDTSTGQPLALMDGLWLSSVRTAALSALAAGALAHPDASSVGFIACGDLAHAHLHALHAAFALQRVVCFSRSAVSAEALAQVARRLGLQASVTPDPAHAVRGMDIVVSSVPRQSTPLGFLRGGDLPPHGCALMACMGHSWDASTFAAFDLLATDDADPASGRALEPVAWQDRFHADLTQLLQRPPAQAPARCAFMFSGSGLADAAAAACILRHAREQGAGHRFPMGPRDPAHRRSFS